MDILALILSIVACFGLAVAALLWRKLAPAYLAEKAKNLASKEDIAHLTELVETVKAAHVAEVERIKAQLVLDAQTTERRRRVYEDICNALRVFIDGHGKSDEAKERFHAAYAAAWLWASDETLASLNRLIALLRQRFEAPNTVPQAQLKAAHVDVVLAMRKDVGFPATAIPPASYQFVQFA
jgi:hypothetical protein